MTAGYLPVIVEIYSCKFKMSATSPVLYWGQMAVPFHSGETIAVALLRHGVTDLGVSATGPHGRYFCGIGTCQACLVSVDGASPVEACLTPAREGMHLTPVFAPVEAPQGAAT